MARLRGLTDILTKRERGSSNRGPEVFCPMWSIPKGQKSAFILIRTDIDELEEVHLNTFVKVPNDRAKNGVSYEVFLNRALDDRFDDEDDFFLNELAHWSDLKVPAIVLELEPQYPRGSGQRIRDIESFKIVSREYEDNEGETQTVANWKFLFESPFSFWSAVADWAEDYNADEFRVLPLHVTKGERGAWTIRAIEAPVYLPGSDSEYLTTEPLRGVPSVEEELLRLGSRDRLDHFFGPGKERLEQFQKFPTNVQRREDPDGIKTHGIRVSLGWGDDSPESPSEDVASSQTAEKVEAEAPAKVKEPAKRAAKPRKTSVKTKKVSLDDLDDLINDNDEEDEGY